MKEKVKKLIAVFAVAMLLVSTMVNTSLAAGKLSGECGKKAKWSYDTKTDTLTISGKGVVEGGSDLWWDVPTGHGSIESATKKIVIKKGITSIGDWSFAGMLALKSVTIPSSVKTIGKGAFDNCHSLSKVTMKKGIKTIKYAAFSNCWGISSITLPSSIETVGEIAFLSCSMKSVSVPKSVKKIGKHAFGYYYQRGNAGEYYQEEGFTIRGKKKTAAQKYAKNNNFKFKAI